MSVGCHLAAETVSVCDNGFHLLQRVLGRAGIIALGQHTTSSADLDHVCTVLDDLAYLMLHGLDAISRAIALRVIFVRQQVVITVAAGDAKRGPTGDDARSRHHAFIDCVSQSNIGIASRAYITD